MNIALGQWIARLANQRIDQYGETSLEALTWVQEWVDVRQGAYRALGLRDYGRIDLRMQGDEPQILDVNPNPDLENISVLPASSHSLGMTYGEMLDHILCLAAERMPPG